MDGDRANLSLVDRSTLTKILLTVAVVLGGGGFLIYSSVSHAQHYMMVDQLVAAGPMDQWQDKEVKIHGYVESGSIVETVVGQVEHRSFVLQKEGKKIRVFSEGPKPDTFKDRSEVIATGRLIPAASVQQLATDLCKGKTGAGCPIRADAEQAWVVESNDLMAKCPSKYDGATSNKLDTNF